MSKIKSVILLICIGAVFLFSGCSVPIADASYRNARVHIVTTIFPPYDFSRNIIAGADGVLVEQLLRPGMESHTFDPTPADILKVQNCDIFICTGGESDAWVEVLLEAADNPNMRILRMMDCTEAKAEEAVEGMTHSHEHTHNENDHDDHDDHEEHAPDSDFVEYDEHVWTDPKNAIAITEAITALLCEIDASNAALYRENAAVYIEKLTELDLNFQKITENTARKTVVFGDRFPFRYLCDAYGLSYRAAFPGCAEESEPSAATMIYLIEKIRTERIPVLCTIEMSNGKIARAISEETGAAVMQMHSCHNRTAKEAEEDVSYLDLMYRNAEVLRRALSENTDSSQNGQ